MGEEGPPVGQAGGVVVVGVESGAGGPCPGGGERLVLVPQQGAGNGEAGEDAAEGGDDPGQGGRHSNLLLVV
jgi:hypothetical protein